MRRSAAHEHAHLTPGAATRPRRRLAWLLLALVVLGGLGAAWFQVHQTMPGWYARLWYPLEYEDAIRAESARNDLDPALVAAVINTESGFVPDSRSQEGAVGLMQLLPDTAEFVTKLSDRPSPAPDRLEVPEVNIAYGARYLRYLLDRHDGDLGLALAAYNGGEQNLKDWIGRAEAEGRELDVPDDIPFPETRGFVVKVQKAIPIYRRAYGDRLPRSPSEAPAG
jgi:soluble lytic murein transglycosylase